MKAIQRIRNREKDRNEWRKMTQVCGKDKLSAVKEVETWDGYQWNRKCTKDEVEKGIMEENGKRFRLTESTPLMSEYFKNKLGYLAERSPENEIWKGNTEGFKNISEEVKRMFEMFEGNSKKEVDTVITAIDFKTYWKKAKERTSSSVSGLHFSHYKSAADSDRMSEIHAIMTHMASNSGVPLVRWTKGLSCMLEKEKGVCIVDKLRAILLMEADFNFGNKLLFGHRLMKQMENTGDIPAEQHGSRNAHRSIEVALNRRFISDISHQKRSDMMIAGVDAEFCYDRIVHSFAIMAA